MDVGAALIPDCQPTEAAEPSERALDHPAVPAQTLAGVNPTPGNPILDPARPQRPTTTRRVIGLVGVQFRGALSRPSPALADRRHSIDQLLETPAVVEVGGREADGERDAMSVRDDVALRSRPAAIRRVRAGLVAPLFAGTEALSRQARLKSMAFARPRRSSRARCRRSQTPASCQSRNRLQQVMPEPQPISCGSISHGMPERRTKRMPVSAARSDTRGRPPWGLGGSGGMRGATTAHRSSVRSGPAMPPKTASQPHRSRFR